MTDTHKYIGTHPQELAIEDKTVMLAPGDTVTLSKDDVALEVTKDMINSGLFLELGSAKKGGEE